MLLFDSVDCLSRKVETDPRFAYLTDSPGAGSVHGSVRAPCEREGARDLVREVLCVGLGVDRLDVQALGSSPGEDVLGVLALELLGRHFGPLLVQGSARPLRGVGLHRRTSGGCGRKEKRRL